MRLGGRISAAIAVLSDFETRRVPFKVCLADWARGARFAGAKDRAWISGLCLDVLRRRSSLAALAYTNDSRMVALACLRTLWSLDVDELSAACNDEFGPGGLSDAELNTLSSMSELSSVLGVIDAPEWTYPLLKRAFGDDLDREISAFGVRADVYLRVNAIKTTTEKAHAATKTIGAEESTITSSALRVPSSDPAHRAPAVTVIPAFNKGWVEVQDLGSQLAASAAGQIRGSQVLDFCAGGGGKTLALAALMENSGQIYAYDINQQRMRSIYHRAKRAGVRNLQIMNGGDDDALHTLREKVDVVFVDAPCSGSGTWRRHPDAKWRFTDKQLSKRREEQVTVLTTSQSFVRPGGRLVYVTCSVFKEENDDQVETFLAEHDEFSRVSAIEAIAGSGVLTDEGTTALKECESLEGDLQLTPARIGSDGFYISVLERKQR
ncbi:MAG: RsmB/NOP family class I SAM-dependent RNA methyltransferase [Pseudomonadota bacterium]